MESEPQPVIRWKTVVGFVGWLVLLAGAFVSVFGCSNLAGSPCSSRLVIRFLVVTSTGAFLLLAQWVVWGDENGSREKSSPWSRLKRLVRNAFVYAILAIFLAIFLVVLGP